MMRPLVRCASLRAHLQEHVFGPVGRSAIDTPVLVFASQQPASQVLGMPNEQHQQMLPLQVSRTRDPFGGGVDLRISNIASRIPTRQDIRKAQQLIEDTGALTVLGVGSGAAMDLVKYLELPSRRHGENQPKPQKVLIPGTSAAVMAANTPHVLILDEETQLLWTQTPSSGDGSNSLSMVNQPGTIVASPYTAPACHTLLIDACSRVPECSSGMELAHRALSLDPILEGPLTTSLYVESGQRTKTHRAATRANGTSQNSHKTYLRSAPLVLATALLPTMFPKASLFEFWAALLPGMANLFGKTIHRDQFPHLENLATNPLSVEAMMANVQLHQHLTMGLDPVQDVKLETLEQILSASLRRD